jgi:protein-disulfide isomerase
MSTPRRQPSSGVPNAGLTAPVDGADHADGPAAAVTLVMYGDHECPYTRAAHLALRRVQAESAGPAFRYVFRYFPLTGIHPHAEHAAEAAEAAHAQQRFWAMHDHLLKHQDALDDAHLLAYAEALDLDTDHFREAMTSRVHRARVERDVRSGLASGVRGTPTLFVDGFHYGGPRDFATLRDVLATAADEG